MTTTIQKPEDFIPLSSFHEMPYDVLIKRVKEYGDQFRPRIPEHKTIPLTELISRLVAHYELRPGEITKKWAASGLPVRNSHNGVNLAELRMCICLYGVEVLEMKLTGVGEILEIDHTSVIYSVKKGKNYLDTHDEKFCRMYDVMVSLATEKEKAA